jgi:septal ring factor EnvC (AmiA/AmiB activator)
MFFRYAGLIFLTILVFSGVAKSTYDKQIEDQKKALKKLSQELSQHRKQIETMKTQEQGVLNTLVFLEQDIQKTHKLINEMRKSQLMLNQSAEQHRVAIDSLEVEIAIQKSVMAKRVRVLYMRHKSSASPLVRLLNSNAGSQDLLVYFRSVIEFDRNLVRNAKQTVGQHKHHEAQLSLKVQEMNRIRFLKEKEENELRYRRLDQTEYLDKLKKDRTIQQRALKEFEANQKLITKLIQQLEAKKKKEEAEARKKKIPIKTEPLQIAAKNKCWPHRGTIISRFGNHRHEVLRTVTRNLGIEIRGTLGDQVSAAAPGTVAMVTKIQGRGSSVIIDHGNSYYTVYGHLNNIGVKEGQTVSRCQDIGLVGDEDSMNGAKLFFQVSAGIEAVDPLDWLVNVK